MNAHLFPLDPVLRQFMQDKDGLLSLHPFLKERILSHTLDLFWPSQAHIGRYFCYVSGVDFLLGTLNKQTYLASREGIVRACQSRFGVHLLLAEMNQHDSHSWLPQMWF